MPDIASSLLYGTMKCAFPITIGATTTPPYNTPPAPLLYNYTDSVLMLAAKLNTTGNATILVEQSPDGTGSWTEVATITLDAQNQIVYSGKMLLTGNVLRFTTQSMSANAVYEIYGSGE